MLWTSWKFKTKTKTTNLDSDQWLVHQRGPKIKTESPDKRRLHSTRKFSEVEVHRNKYGLSQSPTEVWVRHMIGVHVSCPLSNERNYKESWRSTSLIVVLQKKISKKCTLSEQKRRRETASLLAQVFRWLWPRKIRTLNRNSIWNWWKKEDCQLPVHVDV